MEDLNQYKFSTKSGFNSILLKLRYDHLGKYFKGKTCLELGCSDGEGTKILRKYFTKVVAVDGSSKFLEIAKKEIRNKNVIFINSKFEDLSLNEKFDTIILAHILEHVDNPVEVLKIAKKYIKKNGVIILDVPNSQSIHRQIGVLLGMLKRENQLNTQDKSIGHKRVYDMKILKRDVRKAGLLIKDSGGIFLKPFDNEQMGKILNEKGIAAFSKLGIRYPDISAEIYIIAKT